MINEGLNLVLKRLFKQLRPFHGTIGNGYGMPSSHSQFVAYTSTFILLHQYSKKGFVDTQSKISISLAFLICYSRYHLCYHTVAQILVGYLIGFLFASSYFIVTELTCTTSNLFTHNEYMNIIYNIPKQLRIFILTNPVATRLRLVDSRLVTVDHLEIYSMFRSKLNKDLKKK